MAIRHSSIDRERVVHTVEWLAVLMYDVNLDDSFTAFFLLIVWLFLFLFWVYI